MPDRPAPSDPRPARDGALNRIRLRHLQCFLAVVQAGNLHRAAQRLSITQPAVTRTLHELEDLLGVTLFERGRRGAVPTPQAEVFLRHAGATLQALEAAVDSMRGDADVTPLRLGLLPTLAPSVGPRLIQALRARLPDTDLRVRTGLNSELLALLRSREVDAVVGRLAEPDEMLGLSFELLYAEPMVIVARPGHPLARLRRVPHERLSGCRWILPPAGTVIGHAAESFLRNQGIVPQPGRLETLADALARECARADDLLWFTPRSAAEPDLADGRLVELAVSTAGTEEPVGLLRRTDTPDSAALQQLTAALREEAARRRAAMAAGAPARTAPAAAGTRRPRAR